MTKACPECKCDSAQREWQAARSDRAWLHWPQRDSTQPSMGRAEPSSPWSCWVLQLPPQDGTGGELKPTRHRVTLCCHVWWSAKSVWCKDQVGFRSPEAPLARGSRNWVRRRGFHCSPLKAPTLIVDKARCVRGLCVSAWLKKFSHLSSIKKRFLFSLF